MHVGLPVGLVVGLVGLFVGLVEGLVVGVVGVAVGSAVGALVVGADVGGAHPCRALIVQIAGPLPAVPRCKPTRSLSVMTPVPIK